MNDSDMRAENEALKLRVAWLEGELGLSRDADEIAALKEALGVTPHEGTILSILSRAWPRAVQSWALLEALPIRGERKCDGTIPVHISAIRRKLGKDAILTRTRAYALGAEMASKVQAIRLLHARAA